MKEPKEPVSGIIVTSDEPWSDIWHTQLHYAFQLSKRFRVIYLGPPERWRPAHFFEWRHTYKEMHPNLEVVRYLNLLPAFLGRVALEVNDRLNAFLIRKHLKKRRQWGRLIVWHFDRLRSVRMFNGLAGIRNIYHVIDPVANLNHDPVLAAKADLIIVTSPKFIDHYKRINPNVIRLGQGVDRDMYAVSGESHQTDLTASTGSVMLLGTLTDSVDYETLEWLIRNIAQPFCLIGPDMIRKTENRLVFDRILAYPNVRWLGALPPSGFREHIRACRVGLIVYDLGEKSINQLRSPLKVISYIAAGKCVVSNIDCEIPGMVNQAVYYAADRNDYLRLINMAYANELLFDQDVVSRYLDSISYDRMLETIFATLNEVLPVKQG